MTALLIFLTLASFPATALGLLVIWHIARPQQRPADASNRINKVRLVWFALTREDLFTDIMPWLTRDEHSNVSGQGR